MTARRLFAATLPESGGEVELAEDVTGHARQVLRLAAGDDVVLFDGKGREARAKITEASGPRLRCQAEPSFVPKGESLRIHLIQSLPKGSKIDDIVRMCTELGVASIHLASSERSVPELGDRAAKRVERLSKIAREAARQSERATVPEIHTPVSLADAAARAAADALKIVFWEDHRGDVAVHDVAAREGAARDGAPLDGWQDVWIVIGPEGGLSASEVRPLVDAGFILAGLGPTVLRVETAAPVAVALVRDRLLR